MTEPLVPGITFITVLLLIIALLLWGGFIYTFSGNQKKYLWLLLLEIPFSVIVNVWIKRPLVDLVGNISGQVEVQGLQTPLWFLAFLLFMPPIVEEAVKLIPLGLPIIGRMIQPSKSAIYTGLALGGSFGIGEALYVAYETAQNTFFKSMPWYFFTGFLSERLLVIFLHGALTALVIVGISKGMRGGLLAYLFAVLLHAMANLGTMLFQMQVINQILTLIPLLLALILSILLLARFRNTIEVRSEDEASPL
jgi:uncharacterized membrane protein YhfC